MDHSRHTLYPMGMESTASQQEPMREAAARFVEQHARPLELAQYRVFFAEDDPNEVVKALLPFQNADGGFGHALEPDNWNPDSTPITTNDALLRLYDAGALDLNSDTAKRIAQYLLMPNPDRLGRGCADSSMRRMWMKPVIAVMPLVDDERESLWMLPGYMDALREAGAVPFMPALTTEDDEIQQIFTMCDGLLMTGGHDVEPRQYGEEPRFDNVVPNAERDTMELALLRLALAHDKPVFGICRGLQIMNVACGGTLYQDLPSEFDSGVDHHQRPPYDRPVHGVRLETGTPLFAELGVDALAVNSYHHQAIRELGEGLTAMAVSEDGLVEAIDRPGSTYFRAVQWHPEFLYTVDGTSRRLFRSFVTACAR